MKRIAWIALAWMSLLTTAHAASFDCAKASTMVEKLICGDPELSKQDEEMAGLYKQILKASSNDPVLKKVQRDWLSYRQTCLAPDYSQKESFCLAYVYRSHLTIMRGSLPTKHDADINTSKLCVHIAELVETGDVFKLEPEAGIVPPTDIDYRNLDIDGDGIADSVIRGCGTGECNLEVKLSSGGGYDFGDSKFYLIRYQSHIYAVVSYSEDDESKDPKIRHKYHLGRLYHITPTAANLVCGN